MTGTTTADGRTEAETGSGYVELSANEFTTALGALTEASHAAHDEGDKEEYERLRALRTDLGVQLSEGEFETVLDALHEVGHPRRSEAHFALRKAAWDLKFDLLEREPLN